ncbi:MAG: GntR family transcriptional regulator [Agathobacter sp.]|nr:GntR family transcriptional regulator [Agathobacter sp.]
MISFDNFIMMDGSPIYLQILLYIKRGIIAGIICDGDELPSRRVLSALLGVNPNTVQKAYKLLEDEGLIQSRTGAKSYVVVTEQKLQEIREELLEEDALDAVRSLKLMGVSREEAHNLIDKYWDMELEMTQEASEE